jgi:hypothetical protein
MCYYSSLSEVAEKRRQHAEWRIKRMNLQGRRLDLVSNDTEPVQTIRSPNNNEDLQDINSNLSSRNALNRTDPETMNTFMKIPDVQSNTEASVDTRSSLHISLTQCLDNKTDSQMLPPCANVQQVSIRSEENTQRDEHMVQVVSVI